MCGVDESERTCLRSSALQHVSVLAEVKWIQGGLGFFLYDRAGLISFVLLTSVACHAKSCEQISL